MVNIICADTVKTGFNIPGLTVLNGKRYYFNENKPMSIVPELTQNLHQNRRHLTRQRQAVLKVITGTGDYYTPAEVCRKVRRQMPDIGQSTVYRTLNLLVKLDMACMIGGYSKSRRYGVCPRGPHIHLVCKSCGSVKSITGACVTQLEQGLAAETGFTTSGHRVSITGYCEKCQYAAARRRTKKSDS